MNMEEKKKYRFADEKEQLKRVNSFLATGYTIFYIVILSVSWESYFRGVRTLGYTGLLSVLTLIAMAINFLSTRKDKSQSRSRKIAFICFVVIAFLMAYAYDSYYVRFIAAIPFCGYVLLYLSILSESVYSTHIRKKWQLTIFMRHLQSDCSLC